MKCPQSFGLVIVVSVILRRMECSTRSVNKSNGIALSRHERWALPLIFPEQSPTRLQWIVGFGIPVQDLDFESITTGYVFKAQYYLPDSAKDLRTKETHPITAAETWRKSFFESVLKTDEDLGMNMTAKYDKYKPVLSNYRWAVYKGLEGLALRMGLAGRDCVLKSICESAASPFDVGNGLFGELLHILLTPSTSADALSEHADNDYLQAEHLGRTEAHCDAVYSSCGRSLLAHFSDVHSWQSDIWQAMG